MNQVITGALLVAAACAAFFSAPSPAAPATDANGAHAVSRQPVNAAGQPVRAADGSRINYARHELKAAPTAAVVKAAPAKAMASPAASTVLVPGGLARWGYAAYGAGIGLSGIVVASVGGETELYLGGSGSTFGGNSYWHAVRWNRTAARFEQVYVSDWFSAGIRSIVPARAAGGARQIVVALGDGTVRRYDQQSKILLASDAGGCTTRGGLQTMTAADLDGNGVDELIAICGDQTLLVEGPGYAGWSLAGVGGSEIVVGQMDDDPALEIATTTGRVIDSATKTVQWTWAGGFGPHLAVGDIDGDGRDELIGAAAWYDIYAYDVERQLPKWSIRTPQDIGAIRLADIDNDGVLDLLVGDGQWGAVKAYSTTTQALKGSVNNPEHGVTQVVVADLDGDGRVELLWGAGATSTGSDYLYAANWATKTIQWQNIDLVGPFLGPVLGDLDGDGVPEIVVATTESDAGYSSGRIVVLDSRTLAVRAVSQGVSSGNLGWSGVRDLKLRDIDGDGRLEIVVATDRLYDGIFEAYRFAANGTFTLVATNATRPSGVFQSVEVADIDGSGRPSVLAGSGGGSQGYYVLAYDPASGAEQWRSLNVGGEVFALLTGDFDGDGQTDIAAAVRGRGVYVFNARTRELTAIVQAPLITSLTRMDAFAVPRLVIGQSDGTASVRAYAGPNSYPEVQALNFGVGPIDGITIGASRTWWVASGGLLGRYAGTTLLWSSAQYGTGFGRQVMTLGTRNQVFSAGGYGLHRLEFLP